MNNLFAYIRKLKSEIAQLRQQNSDLRFYNKYKCADNGEVKRISVHAYCSDAVFRDPEYSSYIKSLLIKSIAEDISDDVCISYFNESDGKVKVECSLNLYKKGER